MDIFQILKFTGILFTSFLGLIAGRYLFFIAPEELEPGRKYLQVLLAISIGLFIFFATPSLVPGIIISAVACLLIMILPKDIHKSTHKKLFIMLTTLTLGIIVGISINPLLQAGIASIIMIVFSGFLLDFKKRDADYKYGHVKHKMKYITEIVFPGLLYFLAIIPYILF